MESFNPKPEAKAERKIEKLIGVERQVIPSGETLIVGKVIGSEVIISAGAKLVVESHVTGSKIICEEGGELELRPGVKQIESEIISGPSVGPETGSLKIETSPQVIQEKTQTKEEARLTAKCVNCGAPVEPTWSFCPTCGLSTTKQKITEKQTHAPETLSCPNCGEPLKESWPVCPACGRGVIR